MTRELLQEALTELEMECPRSSVVAALREALAAPMPEPSDFVMVPREPTPEMLAVVRNGPMCETWTAGYRAMIAAAPPAAPAPVVPDEVLDSLGMHDAAVKLARRLGYTWIGGEWSAAPVVPEGEIVITKDEDGIIVSVTRQNEDGRIISVLAESAAPVAPAECCRNELLTALHSLASNYENAMGMFGQDGEGRRKAEGDLAHAMKVAAKHNRNGPGCAAPVVREPQPECVPCQRCGFENWIQDGESPGQTTARMNMRAHGIGGGGK